MFARGNVEGHTLWALFDTAEMYLQKPGYLGAPILDTGRILVTPVFSTLELLMRFSFARRSEHDTALEWVRLTGAGIFALPTRARFLAIDPGSQSTVIIDLGSRVPRPLSANRTPPFGIDLQRNADGTISSGARVNPPKENE